MRAVSSRQRAHVKTLARHIAQASPFGERGGAGARHLRARSRWRRRPVAQAGVAVRSRRSNFPRCRAEIAAQGSDLDEGGATTAVAEVPEPIAGTGPAPENKSVPPKLALLSSESRASAPSRASTRTRGAWRDSDIDLHARRLWSQTLGRVREKNEPQPRSRAAIDDPYASNVARLGSRSRALATVRSACEDDGPPPRFRRRREPPPSNPRQGGTATRGGRSWAHSTP